MFWEKVFGEMFDKVQAYSQRKFGNKKMTVLVKLAVEKYMRENP